MSTPGRRAAPKPSRLSGFKVTRNPQPGGGRRIADPPTGELPAVRDDEEPRPGRRIADTTGSIPVVRDEVGALGGSSTGGSEGGGRRSAGRRIRPAAPVSAAGDQRAPTTGSVPVVTDADPEPTTLAQSPYAPPIPVTETPSSFPRDPAAPTARVAPTPDPTPSTGSFPLPDTWTDHRPTAAAPVPVEPPAAAAPSSFPVDPSAPVTEPDPEVDEPPTRVTKVRSAAARARLAFWTLALAAGVVLLALAALHVGPSWLDGVGAVLVVTTYSWAVMARTGGRQVVFSALALVLGTSAVLLDGPVLKSGAAVMTCVVSGVLAVLLTVPARTFAGAVREVVVATAVASVGAFATIGFEPVASTARFEYLTLGIGFAVMLMLVWRLAAGLHGLGTRGLGIIVVGTLVLALSIVYTELLRRFGGAGVVEPGTELSGWLRETFGATPRSIVVFLGVPTLLWGVHMRARRRQGWWVCTFGAVATLPIAQRLVNLDTSYVEAGLQTAYSVALGVLVGWVVIRVDQALTGTRGSRARAAEEHDAVRPEPPRFSAL